MTDPGEFLRDPVNAAAIGLAGVLRDLQQWDAARSLMLAILQGTGVAAATGRALGALLVADLDDGVRGHLVAAGAALARAIHATDQAARDLHVERVGAEARAALAAAGATR